MIAPGPLKVETVRSAVRRLKKSRITPFNAIIVIIKNLELHLKKSQITPFNVIIIIINPLLGAAWPIVYFLQGRLGMAVNFTQACRFVCPAIVANVSGVNSW